MKIALVRTTERRKGLKLPKKPSHDDLFDAMSEALLRTTAKKDGHDFRFIIDDEAKQLLSKADAKGMHHCGVPIEVEK